VIASTPADRAALSGAVERGQLDLLRFVAGWQERHAGISPTLGQICGALGYRSKSTAFRMLQGLEARGLVRRLRGRHQFIEVLVEVELPRSPEGAPLYFIPADRAALIDAPAPGRTGGTDR
jgi:SOS-response transcriptional repressor LexA